MSRELGLFPDLEKKYKVYSKAHLLQSLYIYMHIVYIKMNHM